MNGSLPVDLLMEQVLMGGALLPNTVKYISITSVLRDRGLALPRRQTTSVLVPPCVLSNPDADRSIELCTLVFGTQSATAPPISSSHVTTTSTLPITTLSSCLQPGGAAEPGSESTSVPPAVCPGYQSVAGGSDWNGGSAVDFPPADLPPGTELFRIVVTHVDDECHIYGHALREGTEH